MGTVPQGKHTGFTIVELLIVIVVIGILAAITIVAFNGVQQRASVSSAEAAVSQIGKKIKMHSVTNDSYPADLADIGVEEEGGTTYDYTATADGFCLSATVKDVTRSINQLQNITSGDCEFALVKWSASGGVSVDTATSQIQLNPSQAGQLVSPFIHNDGARSVRMTVEAYATQPSPSRTPNSSAYFGTSYFKGDKVTPVANTTGHTGNGNASCVLVPHQWTTCTWNASTGPDVEWMRFRVHSSPNNYTSDNVYRNIQFTVNN